MAEDMESSEEQMIDFKCPYCGEALSFPGTDAGKAQECPFCLRVFIVPQTSCEVGRAFPLPINTPRLLLRRLEREDTVPLARLGSDDELLAYHWLPATDEEAAAKWIEGDAKLDLTQFTPDLFLAVNLRENKRMIGLVSIGRTYQNFSWVEVTVVIERSEQRKGYGTEALQGLLEFGFCGLSQHRITAQCDARNVAFIGLAAKVGLRQEGTFFETRFVKGKWFDTAYFAMLEKEFDGAAPEAPST